MKLLYPPMFAVLLAFGLLGCKPKETFVSGQIFIVTRGAANIKMGLVEVSLIEKERVDGFLKKKHLGVESDRATRQQELKAAADASETAVATLRLFETNGPLTKPAYLKIKTEREKVQKELSCLADKMRSLARQEKALDEEVREAKEAQAASLGVHQFELLSTTIDTLARANKGYSIIQTNMEEIGRDAEEPTARFNALNSDLARMEDSAEQERHKLEKTVAATQARCATAKANCEIFPSPENYFGDFSPAVIMRTLTDADGKFSLVYP